MNSIVQEEKIHSLLEETRQQASDPGRVREILAKAKERARLQEVSSQGHSEWVQGLDLSEAAVLLNMDPSQTDLMEELFETALDIKRLIYGNRIVVFAPLYVSNWCSSGCVYCGFRSSNRELPRKILEDEEIVQEVEALQRQGHKRILMLTGDHPKYPFDRFLDALTLASKVRTPPHGEIRRINVEIPSLDKEQFTRLKERNCVGTYTLFQETYHRETYKQMHLWGNKADYQWRLETMDRALTCGLGDVGLGVLFGLYDPRFDVLAMLMHAQHLDKTFGIGPHTISIPRIQPALHTPLSYSPPYPVSDARFRQIVATIRCTVPYTGMILSTRESPDMRRELLHLGVSQISAGSKTAPGGYCASQKEEMSQDGTQFTLSDHRPTAEVIRELIDLGYIPSWCTACYRLGRTGKQFMDIAKKGAIQLFCQPNALLTLAEYLIDYADEGTQSAGWSLIDKEMASMPESARKNNFIKNLERIKKGQRDLYF